MNGSAAGEAANAGEQPPGDTQLSKADKARRYRTKLKASLDAAQLEECRRKNRCAQ
jgi:hypothetical protein